MLSYFKLGIAALLPVIASVVLYLLEKETVCGRWNKAIKQILIGLVFGGLAIVGTEWGIPIDGAQVNCRDAAVLTGGLIFGGPAGIIAGVIGGLERWFAVAWGVGSFTRVACSVSTVAAGLLAAVLRRFLFERKKPGVLLSLATGVVMEIFHLTMVFITNLSTPIEAMAVVRACTAPMVIANGLSVMLSTLIISLLARERNHYSRSNIRITQTIQRWLLITVSLAFLGTSVFVYFLQGGIATNQTDALLSQALDDINRDIRDASNENLLALTRAVKDETANSQISKIAEQYHIAEINVANSDGVLVDSTNPAFQGYNMADGEQSAEFLCLLGNTQEYVQDYGPISYNSAIYRKYAGIKTDYGFLQVGYNAENFQKDIRLQVKNITRNRHVGKTGYILIFDENKKVVSSPDTIDPDRLIIDGEQAVQQPEDTTFVLSLDGIPCYSRYRITEGYYLVSVLPREEALQLSTIVLYVNTFMETLIFAILFALIYLLIKRVVVNQIKNINRSLAKITGGDLNVVVDVRSNAEFASLSDDINSTVSTLKHYIDEASARIDQELEFARNIQMSALPSTFPAFPKRKDFDIYAGMKPAKEVGGDFYDFYMTDADHLHFLIADVSGKGIPAAMFMMRAKTELKTLTEADMPLNEVFTRGNEALCEGNDAGMFVTAWQAGIDLKTGLVTFANAGHNPPLVKRADGKFEYLRSRAGFVLAGMDGVIYKTNELQLQPGDCIYLYTDGVTEATNAQKELYGEDRLLTAINSREFTDMKELCRFIKADVDTFVGEADQFDDITMVAFRYIGKKAIPQMHFEAATLNDIPVVTEFMEAELEKLEVPMKTVVAMNVAIDELFSNIVRYGYPKGPGPVTVKLIEKQNPHTIALQFIDEGIPYNPLIKEDPDTSLSAEERKIGGLGIFMVKKTMDDMRYKYEEGKNILTIYKVL